MVEKFDVTLWHWIPILIGATISEHFFRFVMVAFSIGIMGFMVNGH